jgi:hypothetical protein
MDSVPARTRTRKENLGGKTVIFPSPAGRHGLDAAHWRVSGDEINDPSPETPDSIPQSSVPPQSPQQRQRPSNANPDRASKSLPRPPGSASAVGTPVSWFATLVQSHRGGTEADPSHTRV